MELFAEQIAMADTVDRNITNFLIKLNLWFSQCIKNHWIQLAFGQLYSGGPAKLSKIIQNKGLKNCNNYRAIIQFFTRWYFGAK